MLPADFAPFRMIPFFRRHFRIFGALYFFLLALVVYCYSNNGQYMFYNYYTHLADAFLHGSLSIQNPPPWLSELAHVGGKHYVRFGVMPGVVLMPAVAIFGMATNEAWASIFLGAVGVSLMWMILGKVVERTSIKALGTALFAFGTVYWFHTAYGNSWYFAHVVTSFFLLLGINEVLKEKPNGALVGFCLGCASLSRYTVILAFPFFAGMLWLKTRSIKKSASFLVFLLIPLLLNFTYNYVRFGSFTETGYALVESQSGVLPFDASKGLFHWSYLPFNFSVYFLKGPDWLGQYPWFQPSQLGMSLFLTTPAAFYALETLRNESKAYWRSQEGMLVALCWLSVVLLTAPSLFYFYVGWKEFGWRYSLDFMPFLVLLTALGWKGKLDPAKLSLVALSVLVNLWGVVYWRMMNW